MGGASLVTILQNIATFITGPFGVSVIIVAVAASFLGSALHLLPGRSGFMSFIFGAFAFSAAWVVNTYLGAGG